MLEVRAQIERSLRRSRARHKLLACTCLLGLIVLITTATLMSLPAFTQHKPTYCGMEHEHDLSCYSDSDADVETESDWLGSLPQREASTLPGRLVDVARSQLGYAESEHNYAVREDNSIAGYTRYGAWDGDPYEEWDAAFVAFCLEYGGVGIDEMPRERTANDWVEALKTADLYEDHAVSPYVPLVGDLVFFTCDSGRTMVGLVEQTSPEQGEFAAVVGDWSDAVDEVSFTVTDGCLLGYGRLQDSMRSEDTLEAQSHDQQPVREDSVKPQDTTLTASAGDLHVEVSAELPDDAEYRLVATPVVATSEQIAKVEECESKELPGGIYRRAHVSDLTLLDLSIVDEQGNEAEPTGEAEVHVLQAPSPDAVVHFAQDGAEPLDARADGDGFSFETDGFSAFAFAFTVDFYYEGYEYHLPGKGEINLADLLYNLEIHADCAHVQSVTFSDPLLVAVSRRGEDWILRSLAPFSTQETLTVTMENGDTYAICVLDKKNYDFTFNVNDPAAGNVYVTSRNYGPELILAVMDSGLTQSAVKPRSAEDPFNAHLTATRGYHFIGWRTDGYVDYGMGAQDVSYDTMYFIQPSIAEDLVYERDQTFTACFAPDGQYLITFDKWIRADNQGRVNGYVVQSDAKSYSYTDTDGTTRDVLYCYSGSRGGAYAIPNDDSVFAGWYEAGTNNLVCESQWFVPPAGLDRNITVQAYFEKAAQYEVRYYSYDSQAGGGVGTIHITNTDTWGAYVTERVYDQRSPSGAVAYDSWGYTFVAWRDSSNRILTRDHELTNLPAVHGDVEYKAEYLSTSDERVLVTVKDTGAGRVLQGTTDLTDLWIGTWGYARNGNYIALYNPVRAMPNEGYRFDHWEFNGEELYTHSDSIAYIDRPTTDFHIQELAAVFVPVHTITYDVGVIQYVGVNAPESQHWEDVPWCSKDVNVESPVALNILGEDLYSQTVDEGKTYVLPDLTHNTTDGNGTIRVSQTDNGYNLLTHTFRGWRIKDGDGTIIPAGTSVVANDSVTYEAVWDANLPGKAGYYGSGDKAHRYNTGTCAFFVRLFDSTFDIDNTGTYTDCLFTSRIELSGTGAFATDSSANGARIDFYGNSRENVRANIDAIDSDLRRLGNTGIPYSEEYSHQENSDAFDGAVITFEQPFPTDEFIFGRLRAWNAAAPEDRKIQINGTVIPQEHLTTDYFDLRWYVLKDQENCWHVDGMLIPKYAKLVVTKRFDGAEAAIQEIKANPNFYIGVTCDQAKTANTSLSEEYKLRLHEWSDGNSNDDLGYRYVAQDGTYVWVIDTLEPLTSYWVAEHYYTAQTPYATARSIHVSNTYQSEVDVGDSNVVGLQKVYSYPDEATVADVQTVSFTNRYTQPREIALVKRDAATGGPIVGTRFTFTLYVQKDGQTVELPNVVTTDEAGMIVIPFPNPISYGDASYPIPDGAYRFKIEEEPREGYEALPASITGTVELSSTSVSHITLDQSVTSNEDLSRLVSLAEVVDTSLRPVMYIQNEPRTIDVQVAKRWTNGSTTPVTMQLMCDNVAVLGKRAQLSSANEWTATWEDLPAYVNGAKVTYTVREEWIGEAGGEGSIHYNGSVDADGYEDYIVTESQTIAADGSVNVYVENTPNSGQVVFSKVDDAQRAVAGAEFTVYTDANCTIPITAAAFATDPHKQRPAVFFSDDQGMVTIEGLNPGTYYVRETQAPVGYVRSDTRICKLVVGSKAASITYTDGTGAEVGLTQVENPVYTREVTLCKVIAGTANPLAGAVFSLHGELPGGGMDPAPLVGYEARTSGSDGKIALGKLRQGMYYLVEESAPAGYNKLESPVRITVPNSDAVAMTAIKTTSNTALPVDGGTVTVSNSEGVVLPSTGSNQAVLLRVAGVLLVMLAFCLAVCQQTNRREGERV